MNWEDEFYVRIYIRDTPTWLLWSWEAKCIFPLIMRKLDRAGVMDIGDENLYETVSIVINVPVEVVKPGLDAIIKKKTFVFKNKQLSCPNYIPAQEATSSDRARAALSRRRRADKARAGIDQEPESDAEKASQNVTDCHKTNGIVTKRDNDTSTAVVADSIPQNVTKRDGTVTKRDKVSQNERIRHAPPGARHAMLNLTNLTGESTGKEIATSKGAGKRVANRARSNFKKEKEEEVLEIIWGIWKNTGLQVTGEKVTGERGPHNRPLKSIYDQACEVSSKAPLLIIEKASRSIWQKFHQRKKRPSIKYLDTDFDQHRKGGDETIKERTNLERRVLEEKANLEYAERTSDMKEIKRLKKVIRALEKKLNDNG